MLNASPSEPSIGRAWRAGQNEPNYIIETLRFSNFGTFSKFLVSSTEKPKKFCYEGDKYWIIFILNFLYYTLEIRKFEEKFEFFLKYDQRTCQSSKCST